MASSLPPEIIELIAKEASRSRDGTQTLSTLSLVSKAFVAQCQQHLWRSVTLHSTIAISNNMHRQSQALAREIATSPNIGSRVARLTCHIISGSNIPDHDWLAGAFLSMPNVVELTLKFGRKGRKRCLEFEGSRNARYTAILGALTSSNLRHLSLRRVSGVPMRTLKQALAHLESLDLYMCSFTSKGPQVVGTSVAVNAEISTLRKLTCDMESYRQLHWLLHPPQEMEGLVFDFSGIQTFDLTVDGAIGSEHGILDQAAHLRDFRLHIVKPSDYDDLIVYTLLHQLNPASHTTITGLWLSIQHPHILTILAEPFMGLCLEEALPRLLSLRAFELDMHFNIPVGVCSWERSVLRQRPRDLAWVQIDKALSGLLGLERVRVRLYVKYMVERQGQVKNRGRLTAERIREYILDNIYPAQFPRLCSFRDEGKVDVEFTVALVRS
ncbi:hypothetical protein FA13DRAFT_1742680 [Coprinellus micaceus]|uniref:F-box domain-containing protein n=1 Tax=Coprinellus micaceus TaxID=71717 RepID=A0A4Y7SGE6_COPMI|nr:hypothetical protein FA13DRAFT_1742680 [Coprinellus micaceus]